MKIFTEHPHWTQVLEVCTQLSKAGYRALLAGGCVRDALMGNVPNDFDVATDATPEQVQEVFPHSLDVGKAFGVIIIPFDGFQVEVATFRQDLDYKDGRRPSGVKFSSPEEDAKRRDFTVNALFYDWVDNKVLDFVGGADDIDQRILRCVGEPRLRFQEDHLRLLRAVRFSAQLNFAVEQKTYQAVADLAGLTADVSKERVRDEILKLLKTKNRQRGVELLAKVKMWNPLIPSLRGFAETASFQKTLRALEQKFQLTQEVNLWAIFLLFVEKEGFSVKSALKELKCSNYIISYVEKLVAAYWQSLQPGQPNSVYLRMLAQFRHDLLEIHYIQGEVAPELSRWTELSQLPMDLPEPWITSEDLKSAGVKEGPRFGKILDDFFDGQLNAEFPDRDTALEKLKVIATQND